MTFASGSNRRCWPSETWLVVGRCHSRLRALWSLASDERWLHSLGKIARGSDEPRNRCGVRRGRDSCAVLVSVLHAVPKRTLSAESNRGCSARSGSCGSGCRSESGVGSPTQHSAHTYHSLAECQWGNCQSSGWRSAISTSVVGYRQNQNQLNCQILASAKCWQCWSNLATSLCKVSNKHLLSAPAIELWRKCECSD